MKDMAWEFVSENLREALGEVRGLVARAEFDAFGAVCDSRLEGWEEAVARMARKRPLTEGGLSVQFAHAYRHLNFAWNCRHAAAERIRRCEWADFVCWSRFPRAGVFRGLASGPAENSGSGSGRIDAKAMHPFLQRAMRKLDILCFLAERQCGERAGPPPEGVRREVLEAPFGEAEFARRLRGVYGMLEAAWERRKGGRRGGNGGRTVCGVVEGEPRTEARGEGTAGREGEEAPRGKRGGRDEALMEVANHGRNARGEARGRKFSLADGRAECKNGSDNFKPCVLRIGVPGETAKFCLGRHVAGMCPVAGAHFLP